MRFLEESNTLRIRIARMPVLLFNELICDYHLTFLQRILLLLLTCKVSQLTTSQQISLRSTILDSLRAANGLLHLHCLHLLFLLGFDRHVELASEVYVQLYFPRKVWVATVYLIHFRRVFISLLRRLH